jgi:hypothetical protein
MPRNWTSAAAASDGLYTENDFKQALYQLVCSQALYAREQNHSVSYALITRYRAEFREAADLLGLRLEFSESYRYCFVVPYTAKHQLMDTTETLLMLVLRRMYHDKALTGDLEAGEATVSIDELMSAYRASTQRELPKHAGDIKELIGRARRYGIAKLGSSPEGDPQPFTILILPAITDILSESALSRLGAYQQSNIVLADEVREADPTPGAGGDA